MGVYRLERGNYINNKINDKDDNESVCIGNNVYN